MNNLMDKIIDFFRDKSIHISFRVALAIFILLSVLIVNDYLRWTHYHKIDSQLQQIIILKQIDSNVLHNDYAVNQKFNELKRSIIYDTSFIEGTFLTFKRIKVFNNNKEVNNQGNNHDNKTVNESDIQKNSSVNWLTFTAMLFSYIIILILFIAFLTILFSNSETIKSKVSIGIGMMVFIVLFYGIGRVELLHLAGQ